MFSANLTIIDYVEYFGYKMMAKISLKCSKKCLMKVCQQHWCSKLKIQPAVLFSSFVHNSSINNFKNMKLSGHICYEMIN